MWILVSHVPMNLSEELIEKNERVVHLEENENLDQIMEKVEELSQMSKPYEEVKVIWDFRSPKNFVQLSKVAPWWAENFVVEDFDFDKNEVKVLHRLD